MILPALHRGGYSCQVQRVIGMRPGGGRHKIDGIAEKDGQRHLVSLKWQQRGGTADLTMKRDALSLVGTPTRRAKRSHLAKDLLLWLESL